MDHYEPSSRRPYPHRDRPPPPRYDDRPPPPPPDRDMYQFRGAAGRSGGDSYRPGGDFNFSAGNAPSFGSSNDYPAARRGPSRGRGGRPPPRNRDRGARGAPPRRFGPKPAHNRDLMRREREPTPDQLEGMNDGQHSRFKVLEGDSGSESEGMDLESGDAAPARYAAVEPDNSDDSEDDHPRAKRARVQSPEPVPEKPKWSNPDPYTVLPPPDETQTKKKDVVKLIRKAKVDAPKPAASAAEGADFISLNFDDNFAQGESDDDEADHPPHKSSFSHLDNLHPDRTLSQPPAPVDAPKGVNMALPSGLGGRLDVWPPPPPAIEPPVSDQGRSQFDTALQRQAALDAPAQVRKNKKRKNRDDDEPGNVLQEWVAPSGSDPAPWFANKLQGDRAEHWLHNEILDFYHYVKPRDFEDQVRYDLVNRIEKAVRRSPEFGSWNIHAFGSFASGLYLPTADMDLVACSTQFLNRGIPTISPTRKVLFRFAGALKKAGIAEESSVTVISGARVPLVKFVEKVTGLRVDVSFENDSGLAANRTFQDWKQQYPSMPIITSLIKQFLVMRGISEVFSGGLGGYSVICLVISTLQILRQRFGDDWDPMQSLDTVLMTFLVEFGREFDVSKHGIQMNPWRIVDKHYWRNANGKASQPSRLLIIDPNNYDNDISGGSAQITTIFDKFAEAFRELNICMSDAEDTHRENGDVISILERVWGGNYELFEVQRARLRSVWQNMASAGAGPRGNNQGNQGGYNQGNQGGYGNGNSFKPINQGNSGAQNRPANQGNQSNQPKQGKRPGGGDSKPNKKQKMNDQGTKTKPMYVDSSEEEVERESGPTQSVIGKKKKSTDIENKTTNTDQATAGATSKKSKKDKKGRKKNRVKSAEEIRGEVQRADSFKQSHPGVTNVPDRLDKGQFRGLSQKHGKGNT